MIKVQRRMLHKRTDEVSRLSMCFPLIHLHGYWMMFKWSDLGRMPEYLLIGLKRGMPWRVLAFDNQWRVREMKRSAKTQMAYLFKTCHTFSPLISGWGEAGIFVWHVWARLLATQSVTGRCTSGLFVYRIKTCHTFPPSTWGTGGLLD